MKFSAGSLRQARCTSDNRQYVHHLRSRQTGVLAQLDALLDVVAHVSFFSIKQHAPRLTGLLDLEQRHDAVV